MTDHWARRFHEEYERLAPSFGYETRKASAVPWEDVPETNRRLMEAVAAIVVGEATAAAAEEPEPDRAAEVEQMAAALRRARLAMFRVGTGYLNDPEEGAHALHDAGLRAASSGPAKEPLDVEERVELARALERMKVEQEATQVLGRIVMAAGGEVRVPHNLEMHDVSMSTDDVNGTTVYHARLASPPAATSTEAE